MKKRICILICLLSLALAGAGCAAPAAQGKARGFAAQEACARALVQSLREGDSDAFLACFAIGEAARSFSLSEFFEIYRVTPSNGLRQPSDAWAIAFNESRLTRDVLNRLYGTKIELFYPEVGIDYQVPIMGEFTADQAMEVIHIGDALKNLSYQDMLDPKLFLKKYDSEYTNKSLERQSAVYGIKTYEEKILVLDLDGRTLYMGAGFVQYDTGWLLFPGGSVAHAFLSNGLQLMIAAEDVPEDTIAAPAEEAEEGGGK